MSGDEVGPFEAIFTTAAGKVIEQTWYRMPDRIVTHQKKTTLLGGAVGFLDPATGTWSGGDFLQNKIEEKWFTWQPSIYNPQTGDPLNQPKLLKELAKTWAYVDVVDATGKPVKPPEKAWQQTTEDESEYTYDAEQFLTMQVTTKKAWTVVNIASKGSPPDFRATLEPKERIVKTQKTLGRDLVQISTDPYKWNSTEQRWVQGTPDVSTAAGQRPGGIYSGGGFGGNTPTITWPDPDPIELGTPLSAIQLNATADVPGRFDYTPPDGTVLPLGSHQLSAQFTPGDLVNYRTTTATTTLEVTKRKVIIAWGPPAPITSNTELGDDQLNATASAAGKLVYSPGFGQKLSGQGPPAWSATIWYEAGDHVVHDDDVTYEANDRNHDSEPPSSHWTAVESQPDFNWRGEWGAGNDYAANDIVEHEGSADVALTPSTDVEPPAEGIWADPSEADYRTISVHFTPNDPATYDQARYEVPIKVVGVPPIKAPVIVWREPAPIKFGVPLSGDQLNAIAVEDAILTEPTNLSGSLLPPGSGGEWWETGPVSAVVTAANDAGETVASASASVYVGETSEAVYWEWDAVDGATTYSLYRTSSPGGLLASGITGTSYVDTGASTAGGMPPGVGASAKIVPGFMTYLPPAGTVLARGTHTLKAHFTPVDLNTWSTADKSVSLQVGALGRVPTIYWSPAPLEHVGDPLTGAQLNAVATMDELPPDLTPLDPPGGLEGWITSPTGGSWPGTDPVTAVVTAYNSAGESVASGEAVATIAATGNVVTWGWGAVSGAAGYRLYRDGGLLADTSALFVTDTGGAAGGGAPPDTGPTADVTPLPGTYAYMPPAGTVLGPGSHQLSVLFTPDDLGSYDRVTGHASVKAPGTSTAKRPYIYWPTPAAIDEQTGLSGAQLNAVALEEAPASGPGGLLGFVSGPGGGGVWPAARVVRAVVTAVTDTGESPPSGEATAVLTNRTEVITWAWESSGSATSYNLYRDGGFIGSTSGTSFADDGSGTPGGGPGTPAGGVEVPGTMLYTPGAGTVLQAGSQELGCFFTPADLDTWDTALGRNSVQVTGQDKGTGGNKNGHVTYEGIVDSDPAAEPLEFSDSNLDLATLALIYRQVAQCSGLWQEETSWRGLTGYPWIHKLDPCAFTGPVLEDGTRMNLKAGTVLEHTLSHDESRAEASQTKKLRVVRWTPEGELER